jgi:single-strand DNA-binding protein
MVRENCKIGFSGCVAWLKAAEIAGQCVIKGKQVYVEGRLQTRKYENKAGNARAITEVVISNLRPLGGGARSSSNNGHAGGKAARTEAPSGGHEKAGDGIPF